MSRSRRRAEDLRDLDELPRERAQDRISAYVYGNILVLAAVAAASPDDVAHGHAVVLVAGTMLTTYLAHVLAHVVGSEVGQSEPDRATTRAHHGEMLRDAVPILSSGSFPALVMLVAALTDVSPILAQLLASFVVVVRLGGTGLLVGRLGGRVSGWGSIWFGVVLAVLSAIVVALKVWLTH